MSLEEALNRNSDLLTEHNELLKKVIGMAASNKGAGKTEETAAAPAGGKGKGKDKAKDDAASFDNDKLQAAIGKAGKWLGEFKDNESDPETNARREKFRAALDKLGFKTAKEINTQDGVDRFDTWIDKQIDAGRITPEPEETGSDDDI